MPQPFVEPCSRGVIEAEPCPRELGQEASPRRQRMVLAACVLASAMAFIDGSALTVALPRVRADFGADLAAVQWVRSEEHKSELQSLMRRSYAVFCLKNTK